jgi:hypothetical protein
LQIIATFRHGTKVTSAHAGESPAFFAMRAAGQIHINEIKRRMSNSPAPIRPMGFLVSSSRVNALLGSCEDGGAAPVLFESSAGHSIAIDPSPDLGELDREYDIVIDKRFQPDVSGAVFAEAVDPHDRPGLQVVLRARDDHLDEVAGQQLVSPAILRAPKRGDELLEERPQPLCLGASPVVHEVADASKKQSDARPTLIRKAFEGSFGEPGIVRLAGLCRKSYQQSVDRSFVLYR